ncbi:MULTISPECIES: antiholin-like murein hydrolase modulator LrgA [Aerococcus]|uniref:Antiholin-like murein hydrolase modulator LrgA n=1 Tax=Aerococcus loyolae TaxID=2976809 RepID=A0ABT4BZ70_9LACT|nr:MULTISPECIES: antiholin-like murein hydrolase modulator LrgA [Aerococcus]KAA9220730.1 antiholin-like murein hydrolase modulator LrgA [Aerococcus loyolae]KAA9265678.1 antiholin-like murein hydrolase modulator LrgA [Aerococcus loyolae]MCY3025010.1 antiholin-like murein hydrolase modulator LrgA [Aerococcus loyolae]MCY3026934.1 antiholin-like murein hydrolase modulator LrgA [Aerococcus loyolae]MCY3028518.1 antiholin-like murein hydrolase modulator LrgA [Aerococcus loyolae]
MEKKQTEKQDVKQANFLTQAGIFAVIMLISGYLSKLSPIPMPASVIGLILLFASLCLGIVKLEQVESLSQKLISILSFLFVPSGISLINSLGIMATSGLQIVFLVIFWTIMAMVFIGYIGEGIEWVRKKVSSSQESSESSYSYSNNVSH